VINETVWNNAEGSTGGGVSKIFSVPTWQANLKVTKTVGGGTQALTMRGVPDVAAVADPETGYLVIVDGKQSISGGTSAVAPFWAGIVARINSLKGVQAGFFLPKLYLSSSACRDITVGNNGLYAASTGWDACTGLGTPNGAKLATFL